MRPISRAEVKRKTLGGIVAVVGFLLSPLSWWNDLFVNVPLALVFAWIVSSFHRSAFTASFVLGYWLTNVLGLVLMQLGAEAALAREAKPYSRRQMARDLIIALLYTALIIALVKLHILAPLPDYFPNPGHS
jgi:hypothetical protein